MKKIVSVIIMVCFLISSALAVVEFKDVDRNTSAGKAIYKMAERGILEGYGNGFFGPKDSLTRAQAVKMINKVFSYTTAGNVSFTDVPKNMWYYNEVAIAVKAGYIKGYGNGLFGPDDKLTKEHVCVMLNNILKLSAPAKSVSIKDSISSWAKDSVNKVAGHGFASVDKYGNFRATEVITREETCEILAQFLLDTSIGGGNGDTVTGGSDNDRKKMEESLGRVISGMQTSLMAKASNAEVQGVLGIIAYNMGCFLANPNHDYESGVAEAKAAYGKLKKEDREEVKNLLVGFFMDARYSNDIDLLYDFFF